MAEGIEGGLYRKGGKGAAGKLRSEKLKNDVFGEAQQIGLGPLAFARAILGDRTEQHAHAVAAGFFHRAVDRPRCFFRGKTARAFERRGQPRKGPQGPPQSGEIPRPDGGHWPLPRWMSPLPFRARRETFPDRVYPSLRS